MKTNVNQAALKAGKSEQSIDHEELVLQIAAQVVAELRPMLKQAITCQSKPSAAAQSQADTQLAKRVIWLEKQVEAVKGYLKDMVSQAQGHQAQGGQAALPVEPQEAAAPSSQVAKHNGQSEAQSQTKPNGQAGQQSQQTKPPDEAKAEQWAREHLSEWLDTPCHFTKATGRTWRQLAENKGDKIAVNGKPSSPRAYLHTLEGWADCKVWARMKARVALEICKNGNGDSHLAALSA